MATNLSDLGLPTEAELQALEKELDAQVNSLLGTPQESSVEADPSPIDFDNFFKPLDPNSEEYKELLALKNRLK